MNRPKLPTAPELKSNYPFVALTINVYEPSHFLSITAPSTYVLSPATPDYVYIVERSGGVGNIRGPVWYKSSCVMPPQFSELFKLAKMNR